MKSTFDWAIEGDNMFEKISEKDKRIEKVKKVKQKIFSEIEIQLNKNKKEMFEQGIEIEDSHYEYLTKENFALFILKEYLDQEKSLMQWSRMDYENDIITYKVSDRDLSIWLQADYSFVIQYLMKAEDVGYNIVPLMNDSYLGYYFTNPFDAILYDENISKPDEYGA